MKKKIYIVFLIISTFMCKAQLNSCSCYLPVDGNFTTTTLNSIDDGSFQLALPFNFCFYGQQIDTIYINNNGNVSFFNPYASFSATPFPNNEYSMIAPFWSDVDNRAGTGRVRYKLSATNVVISWDSVSYFNMHTDKLNSFQLVLTDGTDPIIEGGNVQFCYGNMEWTTGDASMGNNGFGGVPAIAGVNKGDSQNYFQIGAFNIADSTYDGSYGANDGVYFLENRKFIFDICSTLNIPPIAVENYCDTIYIDAGQTKTYNFNFLAAENNQMVYPTSYIIPAQMTETNNSPGNIAEVQVNYTPTNNEVGTNVLTFRVIDSGDTNHVIEYSQYFVVRENTGFKKYSMLDKIKLFPIPCSSQINISSEIPFDEIRVTNLIGKNIFSLSSFPFQDKKANQINLPSNIYEGLYFITFLNDGEKISTLPLVIER
jgi:hypothetical protein